LCFCHASLGYDLDHASVFYTGSDFKLRSAILTAANNQQRLFNKSMKDYFGAYRTLVISLCVSAFFAGSVDPAYAAKWKIKPTATPTRTATSTPITQVVLTATPTSTATATPTGTSTATPTATSTQTLTLPTPSVTATYTATPTATFTASATATFTPTETAIRPRQLLLLPPQKRPLPFQRIRRLQPPRAPALRPRFKQLALRSPILR
jgi:hypothetical protein